MNRLLLMALCWSAGMTAHAQPDTSHRFLWFTGHWNPAKKNVFVASGPSGSITADASTSAGASTSSGASTSTGASTSSGALTSTSGSTSTSPSTITVEHNNSVHISSPAIDQWNQWVRKATQSGQHFIKQLEDPRDNLDPATHNLYLLILPGAAEYQQELQDLRIDAAQDILSLDDQPGESSASSDPSTSPQSPGDSRASAPAQPTDDYCRQVKADYDQVITWWKAHRHDKYADLTYTPPPAFEYNCYSCDSSMRNVDQQSIDNYVRDFFHPEDNLIRKALAIMKARYLPVYGQSGDSRQYGASPAPSPCSYMSTDDLGMAVYDIAHHAFSRADKMMHENRKNFKAVEAIAKTWLKAAHDFIKISGGVGVENEGLAEIGAIRALAVDYYLGELQHNDWRQIGNIPFLIDLMHQEALTTGNDAGFQDFLSRLQRIWNGFKLTIDMDVKVGREGGYAIIHQAGKCHIIPAFQQDSNQCYKWVVADENKVDNQGLYMASSLQTIDCNLIDAEMITPGGRPKYVGTKFYRTTLKSLSMDFCNPGHDTIMLTNLYPNPTTAGLWEMPGIGTMNLGDNGVDEFFQSIADRKRLVDDGEAQRTAAMMKEQAQQLAAQMQTLKSQMGGQQGAANYEKMMELANKVHSLSTTSVAGKLLYLDFLLPVQNNAAVLVDRRFDAKEINPAESAVIVYGYYTVHIQNDGNGLSKTTK